MVRFSMVIRNDGKIGYFSPEAKEAFIIDRDAEKTLFVEMVKRGHPEVMPDRLLQGLGMAFGAMSSTAWKMMVVLAKKNGAEIVV